MKIENGKENFLHHANIDLLKKTQQLIIRGRPVRLKRLKSELHVEEQKCIELMKIAFEIKERQNHPKKRKLLKHPQEFSPEIDYDESRFCLQSNRCQSS